MNEIIKRYNIIVESIEKLNDTSKSEDDIRLQYLVNNKYVLKMNSAEIISEDFLSSIGKLIERYNAIGVWAPKLLKTSNGNYIERFAKDEKVYYCYSEYLEIIHPTAHPIMEFSKGMGFENASGF